MQHKLSIINRKSRGFTLIELLVVFAIIAIMIAISMVSWQNAQVRSRDGKRKADLKTIQQALEAYYQANNRTYPGYTNVISTNSAPWIPVLVSGYLTSLPLDPINKNVSGTNTPGNNANDFFYYYLSDYSTCGANPTNYYLMAVHLENSNDPDAGNTVTIGNGNPGCTAGPKAGWHYSTIFQGQLQQ